VTSCSPATASGRTQDGSAGASGSTSRGVDRPQSRRKATSSEEAPKPWHRAGPRTDAVPLRRGAVLAEGPTRRSSPQRCRESARRALRSPDRVKRPTLSPTHRPLRGADGRTGGSEASASGPTELARVSPPGGARGRSEGSEALAPALEGRTPSLSSGRDRGSDRHPRARPWTDRTRQKPLLRERPTDGLEARGLRPWIDGTPRSPSFGRGRRTDRTSEGFAPGLMGRAESPFFGRGRRTDRRTEGSALDDGTSRKHLLREAPMDGLRESGFSPRTNGTRQSHSSGRGDGRTGTPRGYGLRTNGTRQAFSSGRGAGGHSRHRAPRELGFLGSRPAQPPQGDFDPCQPVSRLVGSADRRRVERTSLAEGLGPEGLQFLREGRLTSQWIRRPSS